MLAAEANRRVPPMKKSLKKLAKGSKPDPDAVEELRVEVHGLRGAALVIGVMDAFQAGAEAAAAGEPEPPSVAEALVALP